MQDARSTSSHEDVSSVFSVIQSVAKRALVHVPSRRIARRSDQNNAPGCAHTQSCPKTQLRRESQVSDSRHKHFTCLNSDGLWGRDSYV
jgi:hypothetical protein